MVASLGERADENRGYGYMAVSIGFVVFAPMVVKPYLCVSMCLPVFLLYPLSSPLYWPQMFLHFLTI